TGGDWTQTVLYRFTGGDGANPYAGLISDASGALYGAASDGGAYNAGTVFKLTPPATPDGTWTESVLYSFTGGSDGGFPVAGLMSDASGTLYNTANGGGADNDGTVFKLTVPTTFYGVPGRASCTGQSISLLARKYGGI